MKVDVTSEIDIDRPRAEVAAFAADPDNATTWYQNIKAVRWETPKPVRVGSRVVFEAQNQGSRRYQGGLKQTPVPSNSRRCAHCCENLGNISATDRCECVTLAASPTWIPLLLAVTLAAQILVEGERARASGATFAASRRARRRAYGRSRRR